MTRWGLIHPMAEAKHIIGHQSDATVRCPFSPIASASAKFCNNLLSNAVKFTPEHGNVWIEREQGLARHGLFFRRRHRNRDRSGRSRGNFRYLPAGQFDHARGA